MPTTRSEFQVHIASTADVAAVDKAKESYAALSAQLKLLQNDIANAERTGIGVPQDARDKVASLEQAIAHLGQTSAKEAVTHKELHESMRLVALSAGDALGPIGELADFMANPYLLAASGATLAIKMLSDAQVQERENTEKLIRATMELRDAFDSNLKTAVITVTESLANFGRVMHDAGRVNNEFAQNLQNQTAMIHEQAQAVHSLAEARERLFSANIQGALLSGELTGPQAAALEERNRRQARVQQEQAEHEENTRAVAAQRQTAAEESAAAARAEADAKSPQRTQQRIINAAVVSDAQKIADDAAKRATDTTDDVVKAKAAATQAGINPYALQNVEQEGATGQIAREAAHTKMVEEEKQLADLRKKRLNEGLGSQWGRAEEMELEKQVEALKKLDEAIKAHEKATGEAATAQTDLSKAKIKAEDYEHETQLLQTRAATMKAAAEATIAAARAQEELNRANEAAHAATDRVQDQTDEQNRRNYLLGRSQSGQLTPDEAAELGGASATNPTGLINETRRRIAGIGADARQHGGHVSAEQFNQLKELIDTLIGLAENTHYASQGQHDSAAAAIAALRDRVESLMRTVEQHAAQNASSAHP